MIGGPPAAGDDDLLRLLRALGLWILMVFAIAVTVAFGLWWGIIFSGVVAVITTHRTR